MSEKRRIIIIIDDCVLCIFASSLPFTKHSDVSSNGSFRARIGKTFFLLRERKTRSDIKRKKNWKSWKILTEPRENIFQFSFPCSWISMIDDCVSCFVVEGSWLSSSRHFCSLIALTVRIEMWNQTNPGNSKQHNFTIKHLTILIVISHRTRSDANCNYSIIKSERIK